MPHAKPRDVRLYYEREGSGDPPFVFVHGWCCDHTFFQPQYDYFKARHCVMAMDLRGCGESDRPDRGYDIPTLADDVVGLCEEVGIAKPVVVGHSLGGMIAIEIGARYPSRVSAIVADDPGPIDPLPQARMVYEAFAAQLGGPDGEAVRRKWIEGDFLAGEDPERRRRIIEKMCSMPIRLAATMLRDILDWNGGGALMLCEAPLLVLRSQPGGSNDPARLRALKPNVQIGITVGAGHFHQLEVPEQVTPMIERFVRTAVR